MHLTTSPLRHGWALVSLLWLSTSVFKALYLFQTSNSILSNISHISPEVLLASIHLILYFLIHRHCGRWYVLPIKFLLFLFALIMMIATLSSFYVHFVTGQLPRLQLLQGLSWDVVSASIIPMIVGIKGQIIAGTITLIITLWLLDKYLNRLHNKHYIQLFSITTTLPILLIILNQCPQDEKNCSISPQILAWSLLENDLQPLSIEAEKVELDFHAEYQSKLKKSDGLHQNYQDIFPLLKGKNIILYVMESVRHKELPIHGGNANMPFLNSLQDQMIIFDNMYSQDIRSTKAYAALDMGLFSLLSWDSYSNHLTRKFTDISLPSLLKQQGYRSYSYTSGSAEYDRHREFQVYRNYDEVKYIDWNDDNLLKEIDSLIADIRKPFFIQAWPMATHHPYTKNFWNNRKKWLKEHPEGIKHGQPEDHKRYLEALTDADNFLKEIVAQLKKTGQYNNTVIIGIGDHGEAFGEHEKGNVFHGNNVYEESVHVAAFLHSPLLTKKIHETRFFSHKDLTASILHLANTNTPFLNDGRSVFNQYKNKLPIYLYNSWSKSLGIIWKGKKLRFKDKPGAKIFFSTLDKVRANPEEEMREVQKGDDYLEHKKLLDKWSLAMKALSYRRLNTGKQHESGKFNQTLRIYCDAGKGYSEGNKNNIIIPEYLNNSIRLQPNKSCKTLRFSFLLNYKQLPDKNLSIHLKKFKIQTSQGDAIDDDIQLAHSLSILKTTNNTFQLLGSPSYFDIKIKDKPIYIQEISFNIDYLETPVNN